MLAVDIMPGPHQDSPIDSCGAPNEFFGKLMFIKRSNKYCCCTTVDRSAKATILGNVASNLLKKIYFASELNYPHFIELNHTDFI